MSIVVRESDMNTVVVETQRVLVVDQERVHVVTAGVQGPPGPPSALIVPPGGEMAVIYKYGGAAAADADHFRYDPVLQTLHVTQIADAVIDGGNC